MDSTRVSAPKVSPSSSMPPPRVFSWSETYFLMGVAALLLDYVTGPFLQFPILFVLPVALAAWYCGPRTAYSLAVLLPMGRFAIAVWVDLPSPYPYIIVNALVRIAVLTLIANLIRRAAKQHQELQRKVKSLSNICTLTPLLKTAPASTWGTHVAIPPPDSDGSKRTELNREIIAEILGDCIDLELWEQGRKVAGEVQPYDWLKYREAAGRFWIAHAINSASAGDVQAVNSARFQILEIWPEGEAELRNLHQLSWIR